MDFFLHLRKGKIVVSTDNINNILFRSSTHLILISNLCGRSSSELHLQLQKERHRDVKDLVQCYPTSQYEVGSEV